jgi:hypothetical protein
MSALPPPPTRLDLAQRLKNSLNAPRVSSRTPTTQPMTRPGNDRTSSPRYRAYLIRRREEYHNDSFIRHKRLLASARSYRKRRDEYCAKMRLANRRRRHPEAYEL